MLSGFLQRGDTIIEVLLALTIFSLVSIGGLTIMNQGTNASQRALEITLVRQQIDAQAESLRAAQQAASTGVTGAWNAIAGADSTAGSLPAGSCPNTAPGGSFIMNPVSATSVPGTGWYNAPSAGSRPYAHIDTSGGVESYGMWILRDQQNRGSLPDVYNFTIRACWFGPGLSTPMTLQTVVRLYDPTP